MRIVIVDNHGLLRAGLRVLLSSSPDLSVVGEAASGEDALDVVATRRPDIVVMDLSMPGTGGLEATRRITSRAPGTKVVVLTRFTDHAHMRQAVEHGASGYVLKSAAPDRLIEALRTVGGGHTYIDPGVQLPAAGVPRTADAVAAGRIQSLSARELDVLRASAAGESSKEIANRLALSTRTVEFHKYKAMRRLELRGRAALVRLAVDLGWLRDDNG